MPPRIPLHVVLLVTVLVIAGCGGGGDETPVNGGDVSTVAPGIGQDAGLVNATALVGAHRSAMNATGFTYRFDHTKIEHVSYPDGGDVASVDIDQRGRVAAEAGLSPSLVRETDNSTSPPTTTVQYVDDGAGAQRTVRDGNATVEAYDEEPTVLLTTHYMVGTMLDEGDWVVADRRDDTIVLESGPTWSDWDVEIAGDTNITTRQYFEGELVVSPAGRIDRLTVNRTSIERIRQDGELHSTATTVRTLEFEVLATNETAIDRPSWVPAAGTPASANRTRTAAGHRSLPASVVWPVAPAADEGR